MFEAHSGPGEHSEDPDEILIINVQEESGRDWLQIEWEGEGFDDAWILADKTDTEDLGNMA